MNRDVQYRPAGAALTYFKCKDLSVLYEGSVGSGKTCAILHKINFLCNKFPGTSALVIRKTRTSLTNTTLAIFEKHVLPAGSSIKLGASRSNRLSYKYANGSELVLGSLENWERIMGGEFDLIFCDEGTELSKDDYQALLSRLRGPQKVPYRQIVLACNPSHPKHWLNQLGNSGGITRIAGTLKDNGLFWDATQQAWTAQGIEYRRTLDGLTGVQRKRLVDAEWAGADGLVYPEFDMHRDVIDPPARDNWTYWASVDFGYRDPMVVQCWGVDTNGTMYLVYEFYKYTCGIEELERITKTVMKRYNPISFICDPSAALVIDYLNGKGVPVTKANNSLDCIHLVKERMQSGRLKVFKGCTVMPQALEGKVTSLLDELCSYSWDIAKDKPVDKDNHACDAMRYAVTYIDESQITWSKDSEGKKEMTQSQIEEIMFA